MNENMVTLVSVEKIWGMADHNSMPDMIFFQGRYYCTLRESISHADGSLGKIRVLTSIDGNKWESIALLSLPHVDLRDPMLSIMPDGRLLINMGGAFFHHEKLQKYLSCVSFSSHGDDWSDVIPIDLHNEWIWRLTWNKGIGYGMAYRLSDPNNRKKPWHLTLFSTQDALKYTSICDLRISRHPSEATVRFQSDDTMVALVRRRGLGWIGTSIAPYTSWKWFPTSYSFGGPNFIILPDGSMWAGSRLSYVNDEHRTILAKMGVKYYEPVLELPSGGDTSYPGMLYRDGILHMCYYSSHEGKTMIYLARIRL